MSKNIIKLTEEDLYSLIKESVKKVLQENLDINNLNEDFNNYYRDYGIIKFQDGGMEGLEFMKRMKYIEYALSKHFDISFAIEYNKSYFQVQIVNYGDEYQVRTPIKNFRCSSSEEVIDKLITLYKQEVIKTKKNNKIR